ncbi:lymphatic vessel endothelial hyaluronic receptor 1b isoform X2 [Hemibagrus wyckioides]|uniref:lymphatic vessel endothelial hyaluronic receptor 1b isoform X2 n=1 Tax=Hemibagrus wyckioides TaxID=337641 RepID=UPI00266C44C1|nr:lymphatic vessel endothelial hyaluronic receptor 1b isoform X2 [Hemibagrus wyckioides]
MRSSICSTFCFFLSLVFCTSSLDLSQIQVHPNYAGISNVFIVQYKKQSYRFNATTAVDVCKSLGVSIATRAQVETAQRNGLQTCRYGWVMEKIAVIPRIENNPICGQNKTGTIVWKITADRLFDVFCSNSTGQTEAITSNTPNMTMVSDARTHAKATSPPLFLSTQLNNILLGSSPQSTQSISTAVSTSVPTVFSSTVIPMSTTSSQTSPSDISLTSAGYQSSKSSSFSTSFSSTDLSTQPFTNSSSVTISSNETDGQPPPGKGFSFGVSIACAILAVMLLMMTGIAVWYFKIKRPQRLSPWERICHQDMFETEMWKQTVQQDFIMQNNSGNCGDDITLRLEDDTISA